MALYRRRNWEKSGSQAIVDVEIVEEEGNFYARLTPQQNMTLHLAEDRTQPIERDPWCIDLPTFVKRYEPVHKRDWKAEWKEHKERK